MAGTIERWLVRELTTTDLPLYDFLGMEYVEDPYDLVGDIMENIEADISNAIEEEK